MFERIKIMLSDVWQHLAPILRLFATTIGKQLLLAAVSSVGRAAQETGFSNSQKRELAYNMIKTDLASAGKTATDSAINLAIEIAVQKLK